MTKQKKWGRLVKCSILIVGVIVIPLVYSYFYLDAFWNPYSQLDTLPVAVVNEDQGAQINGKFQNLGDRMVNSLKDEKSLKWSFTDAKEAKDGLETGKKYYAVVTIPSDFSKTIATAETTEKQPAEISYSANEKRSYLAAQILHSATLQLEEEIRAQVTEEITGKLTDELNDVPNQLGVLNDGLAKLGDGSSQLNSGLSQLASGSGELTSNLGVLNNGLKQAHDGTAKLQSASAQLPSLVAGAVKLNSGASQLFDGLKQADAGAAKLKQGAEQLSQLTDGAKALAAGAVKADDGAQQLSAGAASLANGTAMLSAGTQQYVAVASLISSSFKMAGNDYDVTKTVIYLGMQYMQKAAAAAQPTATAAQKADAQLYETALAILGGNSTVVANLQGIIAADPSRAAALTPLIYALSQPDAQAAAQTFAQSGAQLVSGAADAAAGAASASGGAAELAKGTSGLKAGTQQLAGGTDKIAELQTGIAQLKSAIDQLTAGSEQVAGGTGTLSSGASQLTQLQSAVGRLNAAMAQLSDGSGKLYSGSQKLEKGIGDAQSGSEQLNNGVQTAKDSLSDKMNQSKEDLKATQGLDQYSGKSVSLKAEPFDAVPNYGTAFAPYFLSLSMWVGALMMLFGIYLDPGKRIKLLAKGTDNRTVRILSFYAIGLAQALLLAWVLQSGLGLHVNYPVAYYFSIILGSMVFITIVQCFVVNLGDIGKFLAIVFLILQLTSCGGTFPMETVPKVFNVLYRFMPMTYTVELLREVISGSSSTYAWQNAWILICILVGFAAASAVFAAVRKHLAKKRDRSEAPAVKNFA